MLGIRIQILLIIYRGSMKLEIIFGLDSKTLFRLSMVKGFVIMFRQVFVTNHLIVIV